MILFVFSKNAFDNQRRTVVHSWRRFCPLEGTFGNAQRQF